MKRIPLYKLEDLLTEIDAHAESKDGIAGSSLRRLSRFRVGAVAAALVIGLTIAVIHVTSQDERETSDEPDVLSVDYYVDDEYVTTFLLAKDPTSLPLEYVHVNHNFVRFARLTLIRPTEFELVFLYDEHGHRGHGWQAMRRVSLSASPEGEYLTKRGPGVDRNSGIRAHVTAQLRP